MSNAVCEVEDCSSARVARGKCGKHYQRWVKDGRPGFVPKDQLPVPVCAVEGCERPRRKRSYCNRHYENLRLLGVLVPRCDRPLHERVAEIGWAVTATGCWEWKGKRNDGGYGIVSVARQGVENARAHRVVYQLLVGPIPEGKLLRHACDNPPCVNPDHLTPGTHAENSRDMVERGRHAAHGRTECPNGHDLTTEGSTRTVARSRGSETVCVECARDRSRRYQSKRKAAAFAPVLGWVRDVRG